MTATGSGRRAPHERLHAPAAALAALALRRPVATSMALLGAALLGLLSLRGLPIQLLPEFELPRVWITLILPGASADEIERVALRRLEGEIRTIGGVESIASSASEGQAQVEVAFARGEDVDLAAVRIQQRLEALEDRLPEAAEIVLRRLDTAAWANVVMTLSFRGDADPDALRDLAEDVVVPRLSAVDGVAQVSVQGGASRQVAVLVDPERARAAGTSAPAVRAALLEASRAPEDVGTVEDALRRMPVVLDGRMDSLEDLDAVRVGSRRVPLSEVAELQLALASSVERYRVDGRNSVGLFVLKEPRANLVAVARGLREAVGELDAELAADAPPGSRPISIAVDQDAAEPVEKDLASLAERGLVGAGLALLVLLVFLRDVRSVLVVAAALPAALLVAAVLLRACGMTLNVLSLLGIALAVGMLLDNSIVVLESIAARRDRGDGPAEAAVRGAGRVGRAVIAGTATTVVVFVPLAVLDTEMAPLLRELALSTTLPLVASLAVALTLVPLLAGRVGVLGAPPLRARWPGPGGLPRPDHARTAFSVALRAALRRPALTMGALVAAVLAAVVFGVPLIAVFAEPPRDSQERIVVRAELGAGATTEAVDAVAAHVERAAAALPEVDEIRTSLREEEAEVTIAFRELGERTGGVHVGRARERLRRELEGMAGATIAVDPPPEPGATGGEPAIGGGAVERVRVSGPEGAALLELAARAREVVEQVPGLVAVRSDLDAPRPTLEIRPDRERTARHGVSPEQVLATIATARREGEDLRRPLRLGDREVDLALHVEGSDARTIAQVRRLPVLGPSGERIPLEELASVTSSSEPSLVRRWQGSRAVTIAYGFQPGLTGERVEAARREVDDALAALPRPAGTGIEVEHADDALADMRSMLHLALGLVVALLAVTFESLALPLLVVVALPLALPGALAALGLTGTGVNELVVLAGVVLLGLLANQAILLVDRSEELAAGGARRSTAVLRAAHERLRPILMTTAATCVGLVPLAVSPEGTGELWPPFARALLGGLLVSPVISLLFVPCGLVVLGRIRDLVRTLGAWQATLATAVVFGVLAWAYFGLEVVVSEPLRWLLVAPAWLLAVVAARGVQAAWRGERAPELVGDGPVELRVRNARKVYGGPPRWLRAWERVDRWAAIAARHGVEARVLQPAEARARLTWQLGALALLASVMAVAESAWGLFAMAVPAVALVRAIPRSVAACAGRVLPDVRVARRAAPLALAAAAWIGLFLARRESSAADAVVLGVAAVLLGAWGIGHAVREGGLFALARARLAPPAVVALDGVSLGFEDGLYGLLGPNGAGKSTLMRLVVNLYEPTRGSVTVNGHDVRAHAASLQRRIGYLPQFFGVPPRLTARQYLHHQALLAGRRDREERTRLVEGVLAEVGLTERADEALGSYSGGMRQRVGIARTLLDVPRIVVVDEPTVGLDPRERIRFRNLLADLARTRIVLLSTHVVEDIGSACREVVVLDRGRVRFRGEPAALVAAAEGHAWLADVREADVADLSARHRVVSTTALGGGLVRLRGVGPRPDGAQDASATLEDAYLLLLGRPVRDSTRAA